MQLCEQRLKIRIESIIREIKSRETTCDHSMEFNKVQLNYFRCILIDIIFSIRNGAELSYEVEDMLHTWKDNDSSHARYVYGIAI